MRAGFVIAGIAVVAGAAVLAVNALRAQEGGEKPKDRRTKVLEDRERVRGTGSWIYDDLPRGIAEAKASGKPLVVVFRCIPCENCSQIDEDVVEGDAAVGTLLEKFVRVRIPNANGLDLSLFQYDYDLSWAAFLMNADMTIYGRYGTRSHPTDSDRDVSLEGFAKALEGALELHARPPKDKDVLAAKRGPAPAQARPQDFPSLAGYGTSVDWEGKVVKSCIHCHQVGEAMRLVHRAASRPVPETVLFPYPNPRVLGLDMDPKGRARVGSVKAGSSAEKDGFRAGDEIATLEGQPILSIADVQWVLHGAPATGKLRAEVLREGKPVPMHVTLPAGWRTSDDLSWRATSWDLRRMVTGGLALEDLPEDDRRAAGLGADVLALRVRHAGEYAPHDAAKKAGFRKGDVVVAVNGGTARLTESGLFATLLGRTKPGDRVTFTALRDGKRTDLSFATQ